MGDIHMSAQARVCRARCCNLDVKLPSMVAGSSSTVASHRPFFCVGCTVHRRFDQWLLLRMKSGSLDCTVFVTYPGSVSVSFGIPRDSAAGFKRAIALDLRSSDRLSRGSRQSWRLAHVDSGSSTWPMMSQIFLKSSCPHSVEEVHDLINHPKLTE